MNEVGGVPHELLFDNLKPVVVKPRSCDEEAVISPEWLSFCAHYGTATRVCFPYRAQTKGKVERPIGAVKTFLYAHTFLDLGHLEEELARQDRAYNERVHATTGMTPAERLLLERDFLLPLPERPFAYALKLERVVSRDCFISSRGNRYSVPHAFAGRKVCLSVTPTEVHILSPQGALLSTFPRGAKGGGESRIDPEHWAGLPGAEEALRNLRRLEEMGLSPFRVEKRDLSTCEEAAYGPGGRS